MVIYIHGIGSHPPKDELKLEWDNALFGKPMRGQTSMAYWSDILHGRPTSAAVRARSLGDRAGGGDSSDEIDLDAILDDASVPEAKRSDAAARLERIAESFTGLSVGGRSATGAGPRAKVLPLPGFARRPITKLFLSAFLKDVAAYFYSPDIRQRIQARIRDEIKKAAQPRKSTESENAAEPLVVVSHSLGTVVAFEVLSDKRFKRPNCSLLVTMGSPLGIREVQDALEDAGNMLRVPGRLRAWHNFADRLDPVALDAELGNDFEPPPAPGGVGRIIDRWIVNERTVSFREFDPHSSFGYLSHPDVRIVVYRPIEFDSTRRFLVARDVAQEFVDPTRRVPVLIEALEPGYWAVDESPEKLAKRESKQEGDEKTLVGRIEILKASVEDIAIKRSLPGKATVEARAGLLKEVEAVALRKYVSARLTPDEINAMTEYHQHLNIYAVWRNANKRKLLRRSHGPLKVEAGRASYAATGEGITWAVLDTGIRWDHPHFLTNNTVKEVWDCTQHSDKPKILYRRGDKIAPER